MLLTVLIVADTSTLVALKQQCLLQLLHPCHHLHHRPLENQHRPLGIVPIRRTSFRVLRESLSKGISVGVVRYNAIISAFARAGDASGAIILLHEMESGHVQIQGQNKNGTISFPTSTNTRNPLIQSPDHISYATVMAAYERSRQWQQVITYGEEANAVDFA